MRQLIAGNWKMNGVSASLDVIGEIRRTLETRSLPADVLVCPPSSLIARAAEVGGSFVPIGAQDCHAEPSGPFTGDISAEMLRDAGATAVIVGHSERRRLHGETGPQVAAKARAAWRARLFAIVCIGETERQRGEGSALLVCRDQLADSVPDGASPDNLAIAYEPVWAIGTGRTPTGEQILEMHAQIRARLVDRFGPDARDMRILYGGSVNRANAADILQLADVNGALVGGASLNAAEFLQIADSAARS